MAYVICLAGAFGFPEALKSQLQGKIVSGKNFIPVYYPNFGLDNWRIEAGVEMLDQALHDFSGQKTVFGSSMGARVVNLWLYEYGDSSDIDPTSVDFVNIGDSVNRYNGAYADPLLTAPADTRFNLKTIIRQYDGYADYPDDLTNKEATRNANVGAGYVHPDYTGVDPDPNATGNYKFIDGNITYVWSRTYPLPVLDSVNPTFKMLGLSSFVKPPTDAVKTQDQQKRPLVEAGYSRPVAIPPPDYS